MRTIITFFAVTVLAALSSVSAQAQEKIIKMGSLGWEDVMPISLITQKFLEKEDYKVKFTKFSEWGIAFGALTKGDIDILTSHINYVTSDYWEKNKNRLEKVSVISHGLYQDFVVPSYVPIDSIEQLNTIADQVGGKIIGIEPGSGLMREAAIALKEYNLKYQIVDGSTAAMVAQLSASLERKEPIVTMLWEPSWMLQKFDVKFLSDPKGVFAPRQTYYWIARKGFSAGNAHAREALASIYIPLDDLNAINGAMKEGKTIEQAIDDWWRKNARLIDKWSQMSSK